MIEATHLTWREKEEGTPRLIGRLWWDGIMVRKGFLEELMPELSSKGRMRKKMQRGQYGVPSIGHKQHVMCVRTTSS